MKKIKNVGKVLTKEEQKSIKGGTLYCSNGPCMDMYGNFGGYCQTTWTQDSCRCTWSYAAC